MALNKQQIAYRKKFKDPRWQKMRLRILERDSWTCQLCKDTDRTLNIHHRYYKPNTDPWDYPDHVLVTLCEDCHENESSGRKDIENGFLTQLRVYFFKDDLISLWEGFHSMPPVAPWDEVARALGWAIKDGAMLKSICDKHKEYRKELTKKSKEQINDPTNP